MNKQRVLILGATSKIGSFLAPIFAEKGYEVTLHYHRNEKRVMALKADIEGRFGGVVEVIQHDFSVNHNYDFPLWYNYVLDNDIVINCMGLFNVNGTGKRAYHKVNHRSYSFLHFRMLEKYRNGYSSTVYVNFLDMLCSGKGHYNTSKQALRNNVVCDIVHLRKRFKESLPIQNIVFDLGLVMENYAGEFAKVNGFDKNKNHPMTNGKIDYRPEIATLLFDAISRDKDVAFYEVHGALADDFEIPVSDEKLRIMGCDNE